MGPLVRVWGFMAGLAVAAVMCGCDEGSRCENAGMADVLYYDGEPRTGVSVGDLPELPRSAGTARAEIGGCDGRESVTVQVLEGVPGGVAVARRRDDSQDDPVLYPAQGFLLTSPEHPLHRWLYRADARPDLRRSRECARRPPIEGRLAHVDGWGGRLRLRSQRRGIQVDVNTVLEVPRPDGVPRLLPGSRVRIDRGSAAAARARSRPASRRSDGPCAAAGS